MEKETKERSSNIEILRILLMFSIILHHLIYHNYIFLIDSSNRTIAIILASGAKIAINCYMILLGYFSLESKFNIKRVVSLVIEILVYELAFYILFNFKNINLQEFIKNISQYWFINGYIVVYLLSPLLKKYVSKAPKIIQIAIFIILLIYCLVNPRQHYTYILWFIEMFFAGVYLKRISQERFPNWILVLTLIYAFILIIKTNAYFEYINILALINAVLLILIFKNMNIKNNKQINGIAKYMTGIYLIHDNIYIRKYIIQNKLFIKQMYKTNTFVPYVFIIAVLIFIICIFIDKITTWILKKVLFKNKKLNLLYEKINKYFNEEVEKTDGI